MSRPHTIKKVLLLTCFSAGVITTLHAGRQNDTGDISVNVTNYFFSHSLGLKTNSYAIGPTVTLNAEGKVSIEFGVLYDLRKYVFYQKQIDYSTGAFYYAPVNRSNLFVPLNLQYNFMRKGKIALHFSAGFIFGGRNTFINDVASQVGNVHLTAGAGITYKPIKRLHLTACPTMRYNSGYFFPGLIFDVSVPFTIKNKQAL